MAKKKQDKTKLDLGQTLKALDTRDLSFYDSLTDEEKKKYSALILMRFMSSAPNQNSIHAYHIESVNEVVNQDFWTLSKHVDLQHQLLCLCGLGTKQYHQWIQMPKKKNTGKLFEFVSKIYPGLNEIEFKIFIDSNSLQDLQELAEEHGLQDDEIDDLIKQFKNIKTDASNE